MNQQPLSRHTNHNKIASTDANNITFQSSGFLSITHPFRFTKHTPILPATFALSIIFLIHIPPISGKPLFGNYPSWLILDGWEANLKEQHTHLPREGVSWEKRMVNKNIHASRGDKTTSVSILTCTGCIATTFQNMQACRERDGRKEQCEILRDKPRTRASQQRTWTGLREGLSRTGTGYGKC